MLSDGERRFLAHCRVARLATADRSAVPHVVPVYFAVDDATLYVTIDEKPKRRPANMLKRLKNITENPVVAVVADRYDEDWTRLAWVMLRGRAEVLAAGAEHDHRRHCCAPAIPARSHADRRASGDRRARPTREELGQPCCGGGNLTPPFAGFPEERLPAARGRTPSWGKTPLGCRPGDAWLADLPVVRARAIERCVGTRLRLERAAPRTARIGFPRIHRSSPRNTIGATLPSLAGRSLLPVAAGGRLLGRQPRGRAGGRRPCAAGEPGRGALDRRGRWSCCRSRSPHCAADWPKLKRSAGLMLLFAIIGGGAFGTLQFVALHFTTALNMGVVGSVAPAFIVAASWLLFRDRLGRLQLLGRA